MYTITLSSAGTGWNADATAPTRRGAQQVAKLLRAQHRDAADATMQIVGADRAVCASWTHRAGRWRRVPTVGSLTPAQKRALAEIATEAGYHKGWPKGLARAAWERCAAVLCTLGLARPYPHGGYEVTDAGRALLAAWAASRPEGARA